MTGRGWRRAPFGLLWALAVWLVASTSGARPEYPGEVQAVTGTECPPPCLMCHKLIEGGENWNAFGLRVFPHSLNQVPWPEIFAALSNPDVDSDGDGRLDISEVKAGTNPAKASPNDAIVCPLYGCGARIAPAAPSRPLAALAIVAGVALALLVRRR